MLKKYRTVLLICVFSSVGCTFNSKNVGQEISYDQLVLYHLYTEAKCNSWNKNIIKSEVCLESFPSYDKVNNVYLFEFIYFSHDVDDIEYFKNSDEETRLKILREDIAYVIDAWESFIQVEGTRLVLNSLPNEASEKVISNMIVSVKFNYLDSLSYFYYIGTWNRKSEEINITKKEKEVLAI